NKRRRLFRRSATARSTPSRRQARRRVSRSVQQERRAGAPKLFRAGVEISDDLFCARARLIQLAEFLGADQSVGRRQIEARRMQAVPAQLKLFGMNVAYGADQVDEYV